MEILCAGLSHHTADLAIRERLAVPACRLGEVLQGLRTLGGVREAVVLSTCNRVEFYLATQAGKASVENLREFLYGLAGGEVPLYFHHAAEGIRHLFRVSSGLDSMIPGETEILGQVKQAWRDAWEHGATGGVLNRLFQHAFRAAKHIRSSTRITSGPVSAGSAAVFLAEKIFGGLNCCRVMILGAGETSERAARSLKARGVRGIIVSNRSFDRAAALAEAVGGEAIPFREWHTVFPETDIIISSTRAPHLLLTCEKLAPLMPMRRGRPLFLIDLAVPRDIEPALGEWENVFLHDIDSLQEIAGESLRKRRGEIVLCEKLVDAHVAEFVAWMLASRERSRLNVHV